MTYTAAMIADEIRDCRDEIEDAREECADAAAWVGRGYLELANRYRDNPGERPDGTAAGKARGRYEAAVVKLDGLMLRLSELEQREASTRRRSLR